MILMYVRARPAYMQTVMNSPQNLPEGALGQRSTQAIIAAVGREAPGFKHVWDELCDMTHFGSLAIWNAWKLDPDPTEPGNVSYTTYPRWKEETDPLLACGWLMELSDALIATLEGMLGDIVSAAGEEQRMTC